MTIVADFLSRWEVYLTIIVLLTIARIIIWLKDPLRNIPGPRGYPIIGNILDYSYSNDMLQLLLEKDRKYGKVYKDYDFISMHFKLFTVFHCLALFWLHVTPGLASFQNGKRLQSGSKLRMILLIFPHRWNNHKYFRPQICQMDTCDEQF